jgi:uncharacterized membrane protein
MLSNHYSLLYAHEHNWLVLVGLMLFGALARLVFVLRHKGPVRWPLVGLCLLLLAALVVFVAPRETAPASAAVPGMAEVQAVVQQRCVMCHNAQLANKNVRLDTPEFLRQHAQQVLQQAVIARTMPLNNATQMTDAERALLKRWIEAGTP